VHIWGSILAWLYFGFKGEAMVYYITATTVIGVIVIVTIMHPKFNHTEYVRTRATVFVLYGLVAVSPTIHQIMALGIDYVIDKENLYILITMGSLYIFGAALYALRIPERLAPGYFDIFGHSHQIFHTLIVLADFMLLWNIRFSKTM